MRPVQFEGSNSAYRKPIGWDEKKHGRCGTLPVHRQGESYISVWKPTPEERRRIAAGENIALTIVYAQMPVDLSVTKLDGPIADDFKFDATPTS